LQRIQGFLELQELKVTKDDFYPAPSTVKTHKEVDTNLNVVEDKTDGEKTDDSDNVFIEDSDTNGKSIHVSLENVTCHWNGESSPAIRDVSLDLKQNDLVLVTGPVGCGKTSLLSTILGELPVKEGRMLVTGRTIFVPQKPWVFSGTVRDNILFGQKFKRSKYQAIIKACDLEKDIIYFPNRDLTLIGERGVLLSGGQRTRIGLARALYVEADVYLLDDPLSAVDAKVGRHIFMECICGILSNKTRVLVTHQLQYLKGADHVVVMKRGSIFYEGTYEALNADSNSELQCLFASKYDDSPPLTRAMDTRRLSATVSFKENEQRGLELAEEDRYTGSVSWRLYWDYLVYGLWPMLVVLLIILFIVTQCK
jgi:ABC-type multidrug transport system fused ATPase/permease subunit